MMTSNNVPNQDPSHQINIYTAIQEFLESIALARSSNTAATYGFGIRAFANTLISHGLNLDQDYVNKIPEIAISWFASDLKSLTPATEQLYMTVANSFFQFLTAEGLASPNLPRVENLKRKHMRHTGQRLPQFPRESIEKVLSYANSLISAPVESDNDRLINLRDRAFLITLADTGLRVHEACNLRRGDIDWNERRAVIIGKGDKQAVIRFSERSIQAIRDYLSCRSVLDGASGRPLTAIPLFARHDRGAGKSILPVTTTTGRNIVTERVKETLGQEAIGIITPHSFRHYFVTTVLRASGNLKMAQELARHKNIAVTQRYAHLSDDELDRGYWDIFNSKSNPTE